MYAAFMIRKPNISATPDKYPTPKIQHLIKMLDYIIQNKKLGQISADPLKHH